MYVLSAHLVRRTSDVRVFAAQVHSAMQMQRCHPGNFLTLRDRPQFAVILSILFSGDGVNPLHRPVSGSTRDVRSFRQRRAGGVHIQVVRDDIFYYDAS